MLWAWWRRWRRAQVQSRCRIDAALWDEAVSRTRPAQYLNPVDRSRLRDLASLFLHEKSIECAGGLGLTEGMRVRIACEVCIPILNLDLDYYRDWYALIVYPGEFIARHEYHDEAGVVHQDAEARSGESWEIGPVIISWGDVLAELPGYSVIIHEMAHKLDLLDGAANGCPPLHPGMRRAEWTQVFSAAFGEMRRRVDAGEPVEMDEYALQDPGEFFAVASECFFSTPGVLNQEFPEVYEQLALYYRQRPG
ncbi:MAG: hypothetical protein A3H91_05670 [Gammaproteobacteria bacterium RIFCSPLOWO2_02_FULL_61_13]|nr:MAG: hypothetical protein A3H91_05670 [Gammaproteobacteria bacterium RIFCSPLOWO2_02_FULL_61_13]